MSDFVIDDWKLKARTVVKLYRKNTNQGSFATKRSMGTPVSKHPSRVSAKKIFLLTFCAIAGNRGGFTGVSPFRPGGGVWGGGSEIFWIFSSPGSVLRFDKFAVVDKTQHRAFV